MLQTSKTGANGQVHITLDNALKYNSENVLKEMGLTITEAIRLFYVK